MSQISRPRGGELLPPLLLRRHPSPAIRARARGVRTVIVGASPCGTERDYLAGVRADDVEHLGLADAFVSAPARREKLREGARRSAARVHAGAFSERVEALSAP
jgi:hypothetical protein